MGSELLLVIVVVTALAFDFTNGFHDTANAMATSIATGALRPRVAVGVAALMNLLGAFLSIKVATTIATGIVDAKALTLPMVFAALIGAIAWNLVTWALSLPSSSSHALVGGVVGAAIAAIGTGAVKGHTLVEKVIVPAVVAPVIAGLVAIAGTVFAYMMVAKLRRGRRAAATAWDRSARPRWSRWPTAPTTRRRRWGSSRSRSSPTATSTPTTSPCRCGSRSAARWPSRPAPTSGAGGSSTRWATG